MKYMMILQEHENDFADRINPEKANAYWQSWQVFSQLIATADPNFTGAALQTPETGTTVRENAVEDGPFAATKEQLGGFFIVDVDNLDIALDLAKKCPASKNGAVEVRPVLPMSD